MGFSFNGSYGGFFTLICIGLTTAAPDRNCFMQTRIMAEVPGSGKQNTCLEKSRLSF
ncbi:MAG: hypothetical protein JWR61_1379 [Ferruginibacter sp.]|nr:hypothetical protein [Ferruginibacter sp.]